MELEFKEEQQFKRWWHYAIALFPTLFICILFILTQLNLLTTKDGDKATLPFIGLICLMLLFFFWFLTLKLKTTINQHGIFVHYRGIPFCKRTISWQDISSISVIKYSPFSDYGGWGVKYGLGENGWCYNVSGEDGIKLYTTNNKPFLIGTQKKEDAEKIIEHYFKK